jgi:myo-inositol catabolism protein IolC
MESMTQQHGFEQPLYILPFDQRGSLETGMFGWLGQLSVAHTIEISAVKQVIYDAFLSSIATGISAGKTGVLVDEQFGAAILRDARSRRYITACPVEKSGQEEFAFEYGDDFQSHIEDVNPTFCKVLVRYNPHGDMSLNQRQAMKLRTLSDYLLASNRKLMFELLVPPEEQQLAQVGGDKKTYDQNLRPKLMVQAIEQLQDAHVEPDIWKVEGLDRVEDCRAVVAAAKRHGRQGVGCIVLGRGEDEQTVRTWLRTAAQTSGFIGFAVGRTTFWGPLVSWRAGKITRDDAVTAIAHSYREHIALFEASRVGAPPDQELGRKFSS